MNRIIRLGIVICVSNIFLTSCGGSGGSSQETNVPLDDSLMVSETIQDPDPQLLTTTAPFSEICIPNFQLGNSFQSGETLVAPAIIGGSELLSDEFRFYVSNSGSGTLIHENETRAKILHSIDSSGCWSEGVQSQDTFNLSSFKTNSDGSLGVSNISFGKLVIYKKNEGWLVVDLNDVVVLDNPQNSISSMDTYISDTGRVFIIASLVESGGFRGYLFLSMEVGGEITKVLEDYGSYSNRPEALLDSSGLITVYYTRKRSSFEPNEVGFGSEKVIIRELAPGESSFSDPYSIDGIAGGDFSIDYMRSDITGSGDIVLLAANERAGTDRFEDEDATEIRKTNGIWSQQSLIPNLGYNYEFQSINIDEAGFVTVISQQIDNGSQPIPSELEDKPIYSLSPTAGIWSATRQLVANYDNSNVPGRRERHYEIDTNNRGDIIYSELVVIDDGSGTQPAIRISKKNSGANTWDEGYVDIVLEDLDYEEFLSYYTFSRAIQFKVFLDDTNTTWVFASVKVNGFPQVWAVKFRF